MIWKSSPQIPLPPASVFSGHGGANGLRDVPPLQRVESSTWKAAVNTGIPVIRKPDIPKVNLAKEAFPASELEKALQGEMPVYRRFAVCRSTSLAKISI